MLCGAMLLEEDNRETRRLFEPIVDYVPYTGIENLISKAQHYLEHENERKAIAESGCRKVTTIYNNVIFWKKIFSHVFGDQWESVPRFSPNLSDVSLKSDDLAEIRSHSTTDNFLADDYSAVKKFDELYPESIPDNWELYRKGIKNDLRCLTREQLQRIPSYGMSDIGLHLPVLFTWLVGMNATRVLEIGTREGHSTTSMLGAMSITDGLLTSADLNAPPPHLRNAPRFDFIQLPSDRAFEKLVADKRKFDAVFIDGWHSYRQTKRDFENALRVITPNGFIFIHDIIIVEGCLRVYNEIDETRFDKQVAPFSNGLAIISYKNESLRPGIQIDGDVPKVKIAGIAKKDNDVAVDRFSADDYSAVKKFDELYPKSIPDNWELYRKGIKNDLRCLTREQLQRIPCYGMSDIGLHLPILFTWLVGMNATRVLEIGTREGHSTTSMLGAMSITNGLLTSADMNAPPPHLRNAPHFDFIQLPSDRAFEKLVADKRKFDAVFIDGWHSYRQTKRDFENALRVITPNGFIFIHDIIIVEGCLRVYNEIDETRFDKQVAPFSNGLAIISYKNKSLRPEIQICGNDPKAGIPEIPKKDNNVIQKVQKQTNVCIMELIANWTYLFTTIKLFDRIANVSLIITESIKNLIQREYQFNIEKYNCLVLNEIDWDRINSFLEKNNISKLFVNTISDFENTRRFAMGRPIVPYYVTIHNFDSWLGRTPFSKGENDGINKAYYQLCKKITDECAGMVTVDTNIKDQLANEIDKKIYLIPFEVNDRYINKVRDEKEERVTFTIPGTLSEGRKDYAKSLTVFDDLAAQYENIRLILLGVPMGEYGKNVTEKCKAVNMKHKKDIIKFFKSFVPYNVYQEHLQSSDYFLLPLTDIYGKYKASGALLESMRSGAPLIVPGSMSFSEQFILQFGDGILVYEDLSETIESLINADETRKQELNAAAMDNANFFYIDNQIQHIEKILTE